MQQVYDDECERILDLAESVLITSILDKDGKNPGMQMANAKWYLARKGRKRGYYTKQEQEHDIKDIPKLVIDI